MSGPDSAILRSATAAAHKQAETTEFSRLLLTGMLDRWQYFHYLVNLEACYKAVEDKIPWIAENGLVRSDKIAADAVAMNLGNVPALTASTQAYIRHVAALSDEQALAHLYVRWLGDLFGGQIIAKRLPYPHTYLEFDNRTDAIDLIRSLIEDKQHALITESNACFYFAERLFKEVL
jgi:heme oxygenase (biliverdin-producing, ferredoxin)